MIIYKISVEDTEYFIPQEYFPDKVFRPAMNELADVVVQLFDAMVDKKYRFNNFKNINASTTFLAFFNVDSAYKWIMSRRKDIMEDFKSFSAGSHKSSLYKNALNEVFTALEKEVIFDLNEAGIDAKDKTDLMLLAKDHEVVPVSFTFDYETQKEKYNFQCLKEYEDRLRKSHTGEEDRIIYKEIFELNKSMTKAYRNSAVSKEVYDKFRKETACYVAEQTLNELLILRDKKYTFDDGDFTYTFTGNELFEYFVNPQLHEDYLELPGFFEKFKEDLFSAIEYSAIDNNNQHPITRANIKRRLSKNYKSDVFVHFGYKADEGFISSFDHMVLDIDADVDKYYNIDLIKGA